jgi:hypothetical protein
MRLSLIYAGINLQTDAILKPKKRSYVNDSNGPSGSEKLLNPPKYFFYAKGKLLRKYLAEEEVKR